MRAEILFDMPDEEFGAGGAADVSRILHEVATDVLRGVESGNILDGDLNKIGAWSIQIPVSNNI